MTESAPQSPEAEADTIALLLFSAGACDKVLSTLQPHHFYRHRHGVILEAARRLRQQGSTVGYSELLHELETSGGLEAAGGQAYLGELMGLYVASARADHLIGVVVETWMRREAHNEAREIASKGLNGSTGAELAQALRDAGERILRAQGGSVDDATFPRVVERLTAEIESDPDKTRVIPTPWPHKLGHLHPGRLYILGAYTGDGKTVCAAQQLRVATGAGHRVAMFTLEMRDLDLLRRIIKAWDVPSKRMYPGQMTEAIRPSYEKAAQAVSSWPGWMFQNERTAEAIVRTSYQVQPDLVIIDHLHQLQLDGRKETRPQLEEALHAFTDMAISLEVPVLLLAQFHRPPGSDQYPRPTMHSFRDTGKVEQLAASLWAIHRKRDKDGQREQDGRFLVLKNRFGSDGGFPISFDDGRLEFTVPCE